MSFLTFILFGLVVGFIARALLPGRQSMGLLLTAVVGMIGSFLGGLVGNVLSGERLGDLHAAGLIGSVLGAMLLLALVVGTRRRVA